MPEGRAHMYTLSKAEIAEPSILGDSDKDLPSLSEYPTKSTSTKLFEIYHGTPEFRLTQNDQTDPVGRYRWRGSTNGNLTLSKALTAKWATEGIIFQHDITNKLTVMNGTTDSTWGLQLTGGDITDDGGRITLGATSVIYTGNGAGGTVARMTFNGNATTPDIDIPTSAAELDLNGNIIKGIGSLRGNANGAIYLRPRAVTDATAYRIIGLMLNPADDTEYQAFAVVPKAATPLFTFAGSDYVPTTSELDAGHYYIGYTKATNTATLYMNEGGGIVSLVLGVMV